jgi:hypothetical protein
MPPAVEPLEERIELAIAERLETIAAGAMYWTTPRVTRSLLRIDQYEGAAEADLVGGILGVMRSSGSVIHAHDNRDDTLMHYHRVAVWGYVIGDAQVAAGTRLNRLFADHLRCLLAPETITVPILDIRPDPDMPRDTDDGAREPRAFFREHWLVTATETL